MMRIDAIASQPDRAGRFAVQFSDGSKMRLYRQTVEDFGLYIDKELTEDDYAALKDGAGKMSAKMRAVRIMSASSVSKGDLQRRLVQKGEDPAQAAEAVQWLSDMDLLDDRKTAQQVVNRCISKGYGLSRAKQVLYEKQIPRAYWQEALADYPDQTEHIVAFLRDHLEKEPDQKQLRRVIDALLRRGHGYGEIRRALEHISLDFEDYPNDE